MRYPTVPTNTYTPSFHPPAKKKTKDEVLQSATLEYTTNLPVLTLYKLQPHRTRLTLEYPLSMCLLPDADVDIALR